MSFEQYFKIRKKYKSLKKGNMKAFLKVLDKNFSKTDWHVGHERELGLDQSRLNNIICAYEIGTVQFSKLGKTHNCRALLYITFTGEPATREIEVDDIFFQYFLVTENSAYVKFNCKVEHLNKNKFLYWESTLDIAPTSEKELFAYMAGMFDLISEGHSTVVKRLGSTQEASSSHSQSHQGQTDDNSLLRRIRDKMLKT